MAVFRHVLAGSHRHDVGVPGVEADADELVPRVGFDELAHHARGVGRLEGVLDRQHHPRLLGGGDEQFHRLRGEVDQFGQLRLAPDVVRRPDVDGVGLTAELGGDLQRLFVVGDHPRTAVEVGDVHVE